MRLRPGGGLAEAGIVLSRGADGLEWRMMKVLWGALFGSFGSCAFAANGFNITLNYTGDASYLPIFQSAAATWEQIIPSYIDGYQGAEIFNGITIDAAITTIDGVGNILGQAGPTYYGIDDAGYSLAVAGVMQFDVADVGGLGSNLTTVILHEMGHVLGLGTLWTYNGLYVTGSGQYTGANALAAYRLEFNQPGATFVPVELGGNAGTYNSHWNEVDGGAALTNLTSVISGQNMAYELMTGWLNVDQNYFISDMTRASLIDLGYNAILLPVPESSSPLMAAAACSLLLRRSRRQTSAQQKL